MNSGDLVLGIDGGGTKTVAWLARCQGKANQGTVGRGRAGPANQRSVGVAAALANLEQAIAGAFRNAGCKPGLVAALCAGLAGSDREEDRQVVLDWANRRNVAKSVRVVHDALPVLYAGSPEGCGVALIAGTGSLAFGRDPEGQTARCGGWGHLFGDEGSAYAIAVSGLRAVVRSADGRGPATSLLNAYLARLEIGQSTQLVSHFYRSEMTRTAIAGLAALVFDAAEQDDPVAHEIIQQAADDLAEMVIALTDRLELNPARLLLAMSGGVLVRRSDFRHRILSTLVADGIHCSHVSVVADPVAGAVQLARAAVT
jgi:N-acetylglucosamine kinase-like BadF-type ATPase